MKMSCYQRIDSQYKNTQHDYKNRDTQQKQHIILSVVLFIVMLSFLLLTVMLSVLLIIVLLTVVMLSVIMLSVVAPCYQLF
jgi:hypothetical protein